MSTTISPRPDTEPEPPSAPAVARVPWLDRLADTARRSRLALPVVVVLAVALLVISEVSHERALGYIASRESLRAAHAQVQALVQQVLVAEAGQRGYLLTDRPEYKEPYLRAAGAVSERARALDGYFAAWPWRHGEVARLQELVRQRMSELDTTVRLFEASRGSDANWRELMRSDIGHETMEAIDAQAGRMATVDDAMMLAEQNQLARTLTLSRFGIATLLVFSLCALLLYVRQARRLDTERAVRAEALARERDRLEREVERRTAELTQLAHHLQTAREDERSRLARELHDELGGLLTAAKLDVARMRSRLHAAGPEVEERIAHLVRILDEGIALKRRIIEDLRPSSLGNLGLKAALEILCAEFASRTEIRMQADIEELPLDDSGRLTVYRTVQEALTNIATYASASHVRVRVRLDEAAGLAHVDVADDGVGFDPAALRTNAHGLAGMRFRVRSARGELDIRSRPGEGTSVHAALPVDAAARPAGRGA